ncbi:toll/interleukin-1 receptor domain-containing protein [Ascidiimonas aurantiaca]|uniref:toll/interleukin-1 receptor domain-containing protein n=1 Tax=Ascidiimonas aurantiaca TaxID=1685432 RepID=UPI0030EC29F5
MSKKLLFISHAAPEDNYLAGWLASKLRLLGYEVWVDVKNLRAGSSFWNEIELKMRDDSIRFIALVSQTYIDKSRNRNTGVYSEVTLAKTLSKQIDKYILPIKIDDSSYDDFPLNILPLDTIDFSKNWGEGLQELTSELEEQGVEKGVSDDNVLKQWHEYQKIQGKVIKRDEYYGSNWFRVTYPQTVFVYKFLGEEKSLYKLIPFPFVRDGDYILGFFLDAGLDFKYSYSEAVETKDFGEFETITLGDGHEIKDAPQKLVRLLNYSINDHFEQLENFGCYRGSGKKKIFYPKYGEKKDAYISLKPFKKRGRRIYSKAGKQKWRFGLSFLFQLHPFPHLLTHYHLVVSDENGLLDKDAQIKARRSIPKEWFNRDWYERILASLYLASGFSNDLELIVPAGRENIVIDIRPVTFRSRHTYEES